MDGRAVTDNGGRLKKGWRKDDGWEDRLKKTTDKKNLQRRDVGGIEEIGIDERKSDGGNLKFGQDGGECATKQQWFTKEYGWRNEDWREQVGRA